MSNGKLIQRILNIFTVVLLLMLIGRLFFISQFLNQIGTFPLVIGLGVIYFTKSWMEVKFNIVDPINANRMSKAVYNVGMGSIVLAVLFKFMHFGFQYILMLVGSVLVIISLILGIVLDHNQVGKNEDILDDID